MSLKTQPGIVEDPTSLTYGTGQACATVQITRPGNSGLTATQVEGIVQDLGGGGGTGVYGGGISVVSY